MGQGIEAIASDLDLPRKVDVVVIGGGIAGASTAFFLAKKGVSVALCEKGAIAGEQSGRNLGWVRKMGRDPREMPLMIESMRIWSGLNEAVGAETGFRATGITYFADTAGDIEAYDAWMEQTAKFHLDTRVLSADEAMALVPGSARGFVGGLHTPSDGMAEPTLATVAIVKAAARAGVSVLTNCAARSVDLHGGAVSGVLTEHGRIRCDSAVLAGGGWSSLFLRNLGLRLPQLKLASQLMRTAPIELGLQGCGSGRGFAFRKRLDGGYNMAGGVYAADIVPDSFRFFKDFQPALSAEHKSIRLRVGRRSFEELFMGQRWGRNEVTPFEKYRIYNPAADDRVLAPARKRFDAVFPALSAARVVERWGGLVDTTPDAIPVISGVQSHRGLFITCGYSGHGFGIGPGAGKLMAEMVLGETPCVDPTPFRFDRFSGKVEYWASGL